MPWTKDNYPAAMKHLPAPVRNKAIEIANALLEEKNMDEGIAIATAISRAKDWAADRGLPVEPPGGIPNKVDPKEHGEDRYVIPHGDGWAVKKEKNKRVERVFPTKEEAVRVAREEAKKAHAAVTIQARSGKIQKRISYNPHRRARKQ